MIRADDVSDAEAIVESLQTALSFVELAIRGEHYQRTLEALQREISDVCRSVDQFSEKSHSDLLDVWAEDEGDYLELALGCSYVVGQAYLTSVSSRMVKARTYLERLRVDVTRLPKSRAACLTIGKHLNPQLTYVQLIDALANYYKHHEEWPADWRSLENPAKATAERFKQAKIQQSSGVLRTGTKRLGIAYITIGNDLWRIVEIWSASVLKCLHESIVRASIKQSTRR